jgi:hypothetical protein
MKRLLKDIHDAFRDNWEVLVDRFMELAKALHLRLIRS